MNRDQVEGSLEKAKGKVKEAAGKLVGNESLEVEGKVDQVSGAVQKKVGDVKEAIDTVTRKP
ncbi:MAG: CsbD family protein [Simplicispira suum]|uniref:CsbD family protein n=1 Tax=Simplicispira suum TaxID=2109915 RepID=UPI001C6CE9E4|nr:CsbD family protein [Simplicispira suum]MBW7833713.1 CsbD family protein [Simplicispira suum]